MAQRRKKPGERLMHRALSGSAAILAEMDVLSDVLERARARGALFARTTLRDPWALQLRSERGLQFHIVVAGLCEARHRYDEPLLLGSGDLLVATGPVAYTLTGGYSDAAHRYTLEELLSRPRPQSGFDLFAGGEGARTVLICGTFAIDDVIGASLVRSLPKLGVLGRVEHPELQPTFATIQHELDRVRPGQRIALERSLDQLLVMVCRSVDPSMATGLVRALSDPITASVLERLHTDPAHPWKLETLAAEIGVSRATLVRRFKATTGSSVMSYLTGLRLGSARELLLSQHDQSVASIAAAVGYHDPFAFSNAYERWSGRRPRQERASV